MSNAEWFSVDRAGLRQLQLAKPKHYALRELIQNAWDEQVKTVVCDTSYSDGVAVITVSDDSPAGFVDLADAYTLFKHTNKRANPEQRGRFNFGEKQAFSICEWASITTTKGRIIFEDEGRRMLPEHTERGSIVSMQIKMSRREYDAMLDSVAAFIVPDKIRFVFNGIEMIAPSALRAFEAVLPTEIEINGQIRPSTRKTEVRLYPSQDAHVYEMGLPIQHIECPYSINVMQKVPLNADRELVSLSFLKGLYAEVLNQVYADLTPENASDTWVRLAFADKRMQPEALRTVIIQRFGEKALVADTFDPNSVDKAIEEGFRVIYGSEMNGVEWSQVKKYGLLKSTSAMFPSEFAGSNPVTPDAKMLAVAKYAQRTARRVLGIELDTKFMIAPTATLLASFSTIPPTERDKEKYVLTFYVDKLPAGFFDKPVSADTTAIIIHELGHYGGNHTEAGYHETMTNIGSALVMLALQEPSFFEFDE